MTPERAVARRAAEQHGLVTRDQLLDLGVSRSYIDRRLASGEWRRRAPAVYALASHPRTVRQRLMAAILDAGGDTVATRRCGAALQRLEGFFLGSHGLEILVTGQRTDRMKQVHVSRTRLLLPEHRTVVRGIPCLTLPRLYAELAPVLTGRRLARSLDDGLLSGRCRIDAVGDVVDLLGCRGRPGMVLLRELVAARRDDAYVPPTNELEARSLEAIVAADLPDPILQSPLPWRPAAPQRADFLWEEARLILEADGRRWHARVDAFDADRRRDRQAARHGYLVVRATWEDVTLFFDDLVADLHEIHAVRTAP